MPLLVMPEVLVHLFGHHQAYLVEEAAKPIKEESFGTAHSSDRQMPQQHKAGERKGCLTLWCEYFLEFQQEDIEIGPEYSLQIWGVLFHLSKT